MDPIKCPVCGEVNPAGTEFCQNCMSRLDPLTGPLKGEDKPLRPGQAPTKKVTAELEPILPQWLREAREKARQSMNEESNEASISAASAAPTIPSTPDLLAGLASQSSDEEDEVPDWLVSLTGDAPAKKKKEEPEDTQVKWVELGGHEEFEEPAAGIDATQAPSDIPSQNAAPSWMLPQEAAPDKDELADWLSGTDQSSAPVSNQKTDSAQPAESPASTFFSSTASEDTDWLKNLESTPFGSLPTEQPEATNQPSDSDAISSNDLPDWLKNLPPQQSSNEESPSPALDEQPAAPSSQSEPTAASDIPDWLKAFGQTPASSAETSSTPASSSNVPDWLKAAAPQSDVSSDLQPQAEIPQANIPPASAPSSENEQAAIPTEMPDWLSSLGTTASQAPASPAFTPQEPTQPPAFAEDSSGTSNNVDAIFASMQTPDWLSNIQPENADQPSAETNPPPAVKSSEAIAPVELPSWVQAMRPVESGYSTSTTSGGSSESAGPLAGLDGVLPAGPGFRPTSKPKSYSIKLNATEEHQTQSALLEQILAAETVPIPMKAVSVVMSQKVLRWVITALMLLLVGGIFFAGTRIFALPSRVPNDQTEMAISAMEKIPAGAPVLVIFDYEPSLSGEMQTIGTPYVSRLLLLKHPLVTILSSSPTGSALAEQFMSGLASGPLAVQGYQPGKQYIDLGYLPGGLTGVYDFAQNPAAVMPLAADGSQAWQSAPLKGVTRFSDFAAVVLLTDNAEAGRIWIEQAGPLRGDASMVVISSSQAGPMLMPYFASGQINGLVNGLNDAAKVEQANGQGGLARQYWDAYSVGLLLAAVMMFLGGLWNLVPGLRARSAGKEES